jgi:hypothetical protein
MSHYIEWALRLVGAALCAFILYLAVFKWEGDNHEPK